MKPTIEPPGVEPLYAGKISPSPPCALLSKWGNSTILCSVCTRHAGSARRLALPISTSHQQFTFQFVGPETGFRECLLLKTWCCEAVTAIASMAGRKKLTRIAVCGTPTRPTCHKVVPF